MRIRSRIRKILGCCWLRLLATGLPIERILPVLLVAMMNAIGALLETPCQAAGRAVHQWARGGDPPVLPQPIRSPYLSRHSGRVRDCPPTLFLSGLSLFAVARSELHVLGECDAKGQQQTVSELRNG